jgi:hypothetical protein
MKQNEKTRGQGTVTVAGKNRLVSLTACGEFSGFAVANTKGMCDEEGLM